MKIKIEDKPVKTIPVSELEIGQVGRVVGGIFDGHHVLRIWSNDQFPAKYVSLDDPSKTWTKGCHYDVVLVELDITSRVV